MLGKLGYFANYPRRKYPPHDCTKLSGGIFVPFHCLVKSNIGDKSLPMEAEGEYNEGGGR